MNIDRDNPYQIEASGNDIASTWAQFLRSNADSLAMGGHTANASIARYIGENPTQLASTLILVHNYDAAIDPVGADSLMNLIEPAARPSNITDGFNFLLQRMVHGNAMTKVKPFRYLDRNDSLRTFTPTDNDLSIIAIDNNRSGRSDSIIPALKRISRNGGRHLHILEFSIDADTMEWKRNTRYDSATWIQTWGAGAFAARGIDSLAIPSIPYFIVVDSTGTQVLRSSSVTDAERIVSTLLDNL